MYLAGVSVRRVEDITEALWGTQVSPSTVSDLNKKIYGTIETWRNRPIEGQHPYVHLDDIVLKRSWAGEVRNVSLLVAIGVNGEGYREILGICEGAKEDKAGWSGFLKHLKERGLCGVRLIISDVQGCARAASVAVVCLLSVSTVSALADEFEWGPLSTKPRDNQNATWDAHCTDSSAHVVSGRCTITDGRVRYRTSA
jgi:Transposase, Mutator family